MLGGTERDRWLPYRSVLRLLALPERATVVDFGAGTGVVAIPLALDRPGVTVVAFDEQPAMLERLQAAAGAVPPANLVATGSEGIAAFMGSAQRVLALNVLHEAGDASLRQIRELLAKDGYVVVIDWRADVERGVGPPAAHVLTAAEATARLEAAGFAVTDGSAEDFPYHYVLLARERAAPERPYAELVARLRASAGTRLAIDTASGTFEGYVLVDWLGDSSVTLLVAERPGDDPSRAFVIDLASIGAVRGA